MASTSLPVPPASGGCSSSSSSASADLLMVSLSRFYAQRQHMQAVLPYLTGESCVSLRLVDWFVTNYARRHNVVLSRPSGSGGGSSVSAVAGGAPVNVHLSYRAQLKAYSKQLFDPFRRRDRIHFYYESSKYVETTIGQLNFFRWMLQNDVLSYLGTHASVVEADMFGAHRRSRRGPGQEQEHEQEQEQGQGQEEDGEGVPGPADQEDAAEGGGGGGSSGGRPARPRAAPSRCCPAADTAQSSQQQQRCKAAQNMTRLVGERVVSFD